MKILLTFIVGFGLVFTNLDGRADETAAGPELATQMFKVDVETFVSHLKLLVPPKEGEASQDLLLRVLKDRHITIEKPASVVFVEKNGILSVHATQVDMKKIGALISEIAAKPRSKDDPTTTDVPARFAFITKKTTLQQVIDRIGKYDRVRGKGGAYYEYDLPDGSAVLVCPEPPFQLTNKIGGVTYFESTNYIHF